METLRPIWSLCFAAWVFCPVSTMAATKAESGAAAIARAVEGIGGGAALDAVRSITVEGESTRATPQGVVSTPTRSLVEFPVSYRQEIVLNGATVAMTSSTDGAFLIAGESVQPLSDAQRQNIEVTALRSPLVLLKMRRNTQFGADADGTGKLGDREVEFVQVYVGNESMRLAIEKATGHIVQEEFDTRGGIPERAGRMVVTFSDFRRLSNGIVLAHSSNGRFDGEVAFTNRITSVKFNERYAEGTFGPAPSLPSQAPPRK